jgi:nitrite reductase/ring-hydroxylating ferredoxin subunit
MTQDQAPPGGPDLTQGIAVAELVDGKLVGHVGQEEVLLVRKGTEVFAIGARCSHYHGPLVEGIVVGESVRCPWHHACFDLRTGEAIRAPAVIRLERKHEGRTLPYELVADRIADYLRESVRRRADAQYVARLVSAARIEGIELAGADALRVH